MSMIDHGPANRRLRRNRAAPQVIAKGKPAWKRDKI
jgi:hypothetical protein